MDKHIKAKQQKPAKTMFTSVQIGFLQRKCACGGTPGVDGECAECRAKRLSMQRSATPNAGPSAVPPIVHEVLRSPGQPLDTGTRTFMEPRFGHDFSHVKVHTDVKAAESAREVNALAYTVGRNVVFGAGRYAPQTGEGKGLLAHELTHVVQQSSEMQLLPATLEITDPADTAERNAQDTANSIVQGQSITPALRGSIKIARQKTTPAPTAKAVPGEKETRPFEEVANIADTISIEGDPKKDPFYIMKHPNYIQNVIKGVGIFGLAGPFRLDRQVVNGMGVDSIILPRDEFNLENDPLKKEAGIWPRVYKSRATAERALSELGIPNLYTFYIGPGGHIYPTIISDTTAPYLCATLRKMLEVERTDAKAAEKLSIDLLFWYVGARFPIKTGEPIPKSVASGGSAARTAVAGGERALVFVEIGAGDLKASIELAKKGVKVIAVDPVAPAAEAIKDLEAAGGTFIKGTAKDLSAATADHVIQYFPYPMKGAGMFATKGTGTFSLIQDTLRLLKPGGAAHFVTEDFATAEFLAKEAGSGGIRAVITETTAGATAPGASGAGVPSFGKALKVWLVNIYK